MTSFTLTKISISDIQDIFSKLSDHFGTIKTGDFIISSDTITAEAIKNYHLSKDKSIVLFDMKITSPVLSKHRIMNVIAEYDAEYFFREFVDESDYDPIQ